MWRQLKSVDSVALVVAVVVIIGAGGWLLTRQSVNSGELAVAQPVNGLTSSEVEGETPPDGPSIGEDPADSLEADSPGTESTATGSEGTSSEPSSTTAPSTQASVSTTTEQSTTERPTTEPPTTEQSTTERPTTEPPTTSTSTMPPTPESGLCVLSAAQLPSSDSARQFLAPTDVCPEIRLAVNDSADFAGTYPVDWSSQSDYCNAAQMVQSIWMQFGSMGWVNTRVFEPGRSYGLYTEPSTDSARAGTRSHVELVDNFSAIAFEIDPRSGAQDTSVFYCHTARQEPWAFVVASVVE